MCNSELVNIFRYFYIFFFFIRTNMLTAVVRFIYKLQSGVIGWGRMCFADQKGLLRQQILAGA